MMRLALISATAVFAENVDGQLDGQLALRVANTQADRELFDWGSFFNTALQSAVVDQKNPDQDTLFVNALDFIVQKNLTKWTNSMPEGSLVKDIVLIVFDAIKKELLSKLMPGTSKDKQFMKIACVKIARVMAQRLDDKLDDVKNELRGQDELDGEQVDRVLFFKDMFNALKNEVSHMAFGALDSLVQRKVHRWTMNLPCKDLVREIVQTLMSALKNELFSRLFPGEHEDSPYLKIAVVEIGQAVAAHVDEKLDKAHLQLDPEA